MNKTSLWTVGSLAAAVLIGVASFFLLAPKLPTDEPLPSEMPSSAAPVLQEKMDERADDYNYIIKIYEGRLAVFKKDSEEPDMVLNVYEKYLPEYDREQLKEGIQVKEYEELLALLEDYGS